MTDRSEHPVRVARWLWDKILEPAYLNFLNSPWWAKASLPLGTLVLTWLSLWIAADINLRNAAAAYYWSLVE